MTITTPLDARRAELLERFRSQDVLPRIWGRDHTVWDQEPAEASNRLGWLDTHERTRERAGALASFAAMAAADGLDRVVLCGMGGSSLAPEVLARAVAPAEEGLDLLVLDTTHPDDIRAAERSIDPERTLFLIASKSGTTLETLCQLDYFWERVPNGRRFAAVTDPGTALAGLARKREFREVFSADPDVGGRYSALTMFGAVPAALLGVDLEALLGGATEMAAACGRDVDLESNPAVTLGLEMAAAALAGRDKLTLVLPERLAPFGPWVEQLVAESTGKRERGILPVEGEDLGAPDAYGDDRLFVSYESGPGVDALETAGHPMIRLEPAGDGARGLGAEFFRWELAVAIAGWGIGIQPFDQPNVQEAKDATKAVLEKGPIEDVGPDALEPLLDHMSPGDYLAIQAYLPRNDDLVHRLHAVRMRLRDRLRAATTVGFGPRFLHSTGQLHKGGPATGVFVQVTDEPVEDASIPGRPFTFGELIRAQALGDLRALRSRGRRVARVHLSDLESA
ncbi:MAG: glucose-6-phosphate isomerase [Actinobacteria bacterium]|nr:glucose-6-phosphate isomerase [Actinomycetota bacterium]